LKRKRGVQKRAVNSVLTSGVPKMLPANRFNRAFVLQGPLKVQPPSVEEVFDFSSQHRRLQ
jgi:hypothetical protein